ncbi:hypothetical protein VB773_15225 [Haloarculaceae archaeon H-GB2-1]|nr:hypothetical protein [Haloarculaceae archaeon H-GB1-1]MEA5387316.1 hypothetical protein [Haloarculaceae archaeon H-GB11]MEA5408782.1 hypothetical protein [Haloarculaceae archaeon H-GB2-1]
MTELTERTHSREVAVLVLVVAVELLLVAAHFTFTAAEVRSLGSVLAPFVWMNVGLWAVLRTSVPAVPDRQRAGAVAVGAVYFLVLGWLSGLFGIVTDAPSLVTGFHVGRGSPGWERLVYVAPPVFVSLVPYKLVGYLSLAYLVYASVLDAASSVVSGTLGILSCISCTFPVIASLLAGVVGGASGIATIYANAVLVSTVVYVLAVGLLYWRLDLWTLRKVMGR